MYVVEHHSGKPADAVISDVFLLVDLEGVEPSSGQENYHDVYKYVSALGGTGSFKADQTRASVLTATFVSRVSVTRDAAYWI